MAKNNGNTTSEVGFLVQIGETLQTAIVGVLDGSSTIFRSVFGTFKDSTVFAIRSSREVADELGKSIKGCTLGTIEGTHEISVKAAHTFSKTIVDLSQCTYDTSAKVGNILKNASLNTIRGTAEVTNELFGKIKSGVGGVIPFERLKIGKKKVVNGPVGELENN